MTIPAHPRRIWHIADNERQAQQLGGSACDTFAALRQVSASKRILTHPAGRWEVPRPASATARIACVQREDIALAEIVFGHVRISS